MGVNDAIIPLVEIMKYDLLHDMDDPIVFSHATLASLCDVLLYTNVDHVDFSSCDDIVMILLCNKCSFKCLVCNNACMIAHENSPIEFSHNGILVFSML